MLINRKDVIRMFVPFPSITSGLATASHMYICRNHAGNEYEYIKCQTLKPYMLVNCTMTHYHDEKPDISRNPFLRATRIDCDKLFLTHTVSYNDRMKTTSRPDVCDDVLQKVERELMTDGFADIHINETELKTLNNGVK